MALLVLLYRLLPAVSVVPTALIISALCGAATVALVGRLLVRWGVSNGWLTLCLGLLVLNPWLTLQWVNGLETSVACLLLVATWVYADRVIRENTLFLRQAVIISALASLAALGRTDFAIALAPILVYVWWRLWRGSTRRLVSAIGYGSLMAGVVLIIQAPWLAWNWHTFGTLMQSSGSSFSFVNHQLLYNVHANDLLTNIKGAILGLWNSGGLVFYALVSPLIYALVLGITALWRKRQALTFKLPGGSFIALAGIGVVLLFAVHGAIRWAYRPWYAAPIILIFVLFIGYCSRGLPRLPIPRKLVVTLVVLGIASFGLATPRVLAEYNSQQKMYEVAQWINTNVQANEKVAAFNSGIYAYFSDRQIINLDGLVNNSAATELRNKNLHDYVLAEGVSYIIDFDISVNYRYAWAWGGKTALADLPVIATFDGGQRNGTIRVYDLR